MAPHIQHNSWFSSGLTRTGVNEGWMDFTPGHFSEIPGLMSHLADVVMAIVSPLDKHGYFTLGVTVDYTSNAAARARLVIVEVNPNMPRTLGSGHLHVSEVSYIVEDGSPIAELPDPPITETDAAIGRYIAELIEDGSTVQIGIGGIPNAVAKLLAEKKDLGIHTEMLTSSIVDLVEAGAVTGKKKTLHPGKIIGNFAFGTRRLYDFMDDNPSVEMHSVAYTNNPYVIGQNYKMVSINSTLEVDFLGQCASESIGPKQFSGTGGQSDFVRGANLSPGGKSFMALPSTAKDGKVSRIVPMLAQGAVVTTSKNDVDHVVTEFGVAKLRGKTARERALALISIAHPDFRAELKDGARKMGLI
ncbi:MAG: 4-hydroxybutyrate CoA-transferase [Firmicutes bacterium]|nr:4-hydroxybutyrate CoA-transferase [Bacillota bacterium]